MLSSNETLTKLIGSIYDAAADASLWEPFLGDLASTFQADAAGLLMHDNRQETHAIATSFRVAPEMLILYRDYYGPLDPWAARARSKVAGSVFPSQTLCTHNELAVTEAYNEFMVPFEIEYGLFGIIEKAHSQWANVSLYRCASSPEFQVSDGEVLGLLVPHIQRAFKLHFQFSELKARSEGIEKALDMLAAGVIFVGTNGEVLLMNRNAEEIFCRKDGLLLTKGKLSAAIHTESVLLQAMIGGAVLTGSGKGLGAGGTIPITREKGRPLSVTVAPFRGFSCISPQRPATVLFISDPERDAELSIDLLRRAYGLTPAEAKLASILVEGHSLKESAALCRVTHNTAKSQLKSVFSKTEVKRQSELIRLLLNSAGIIRPNAESM